MGYRFLKYAAGIALFMAIGSLIWLSVSTKNKFPIEASNSLIMKGKNNICQWFNQRV